MSVVFRRSLVLLVPIVWCSCALLSAEESPASGTILGTVQAEDFVAQQGAQGVADVTSAVGGKVLGYDFGRHPGQFAQFELTASGSVKPGTLWFRVARDNIEPATWEVHFDGKRLPDPIKVENTGSWFTYQWTTVSVPEITKGSHTLKIVSGHENANVNFDMIVLSGPDLDAEMLDFVGTGDLGDKLASLRRAMDHLAAKFPDRYDTDGQLRREVDGIKAESGKPKAEILACGRLKVLLRRALLEENPLMQFGPLLFNRRHPLGYGGGHYAYTETLSWFREMHPTHRVFRPGSALCTLSSPWPGGKLDVLIDSPTGVIRDPDVHFDGRKILLAHKKSLDDDDYHLYELDVETRALRQLTSDAGFADYEGCYLPDGNILFNSTRCVQTVDCFPTPVSNIYAMDGEGRNIRRVTVNAVHDNFPVVLNDGRVVFTRWEYNDRWVIHVQGLAVMNPDGTARTAYYGNNSFWPISMLHARSIPGSDRIVCTVSGHHITSQWGELGVFDVSLGTEEATGCVHLWPPRKIEPIKNELYWQKLSAWYQYPWPLSENFFLVSCKPRHKRHFGIYLVDTFGNRVLIHEEPDISCASPMPLAARPRPPVIPSSVRYAEKEATVCLVDVYAGSGMEGVQRGEVKSLRVIELSNRPMGNRQWAGNDGTPPMGLNSCWDAKRVVGTVPVDEDGSAVLKVPAGTALFFQPLNEQGMALQWERSWVTLQPGEMRTCFGCHANKHEAPAALQGELQNVLARTPLRPDPDWCAVDRPLNFHDDVQPVLDAACVSCHHQDDPAGLDLRSDKTDGFSLGYEHLRRFVKVAGTRSDPPAIAAKSVGAIASPLIELLRKGHYDVELTPEQWSRLITWIDLSAPYYGTYMLTRYDAPFGRCIVRDAQPLWDALGEGCVKCHKRSDPHGFPEQMFDWSREGRGFQWRVNQTYDTTNAVLINLTHPEQSRLLRGPLAKESGGLATCPEVPFATTEDARYQSALSVIQGWARQLAEKPREDMPGAKPCPEYLVWWNKRLESNAIERRSRQALADRQR